MALNVHIARNSLTVGIAVAGTILAVGCGSQHSRPPPQATSQASAANSSVSPASTSSTPTSAETTSSAPATQTSAAPAGAAACSSSNLHISLGNGGAGAGTDFTVIDFTNSGGAPCTLYGFPGVSLTNSSGAQIGAAATRNPSKASTVVTLAPGAKA